MDTYKNVLILTTAIEGRPHFKHVTYEYTNIYILNKTHYSLLIINHSSKIYFLKFKTAICIVYSDTDVQSKS